MASKPEAESFLTKGSSEAAIVQKAAGCAGVQKLREALAHGNEAEDFSTRVKKFL